VISLELTGKSILVNSVRAWCGQAAWRLL